MYHACHIHITKEPDGRRSPSVSIQEGEGGSRLQETNVLHHALCVTIKSPPVLLHAGLLRAWRSSLGVLRAGVVRSVCGCAGRRTGVLRAGRTVHGTSARPGRPRRHASSRAGAGRSRRARAGREGGWAGPAAGATEMLATMHVAWADGKRAAPAQRQRCAGRQQQQQQHDGGAPGHGLDTRGGA